MGHVRLNPKAEIVVGAWLDSITSKEEDEMNTYKRGYYCLGRL